ncbi:FAD-dependent oxidoreductase [Longimicrobium sp.]|uniref:FAD-dependent oxidoreductase n=1 Tax=Longimicrobium sp. TaxID=2029185 RepID=UPI002BEF55CB|nr:FAD-dependent oxidoreductase [Longimicrobium sp.]HSU16307.1 FAD-dependent oxidoreductase [Longimicrobium sp.]
MATDYETAFPRLTPAQIHALCPAGTRRDTRDGEFLWRAGDRGFGFFVLISGRVEILDPSGDAPRQVVIHEPGHFTGDVDVLTGRASLVDARVIEPGEVLELAPDALRRAAGEQPELSELLLRAFLMRRTLLLDQGYQGIKIIGSSFSPQAHHLREFCSRNAIPYTWLDLEADPHAEELLRAFGVGPEQTPIVIGRDGKWVSSPDVADLAHYMGLDVRVAPGAVYDLVVVGAGPAGLAASVYASSEGLKTLTLDGVAAGGQAGTSSRIENYLGFPMGISGAELTRNAMLQAQKFGAQISVPGTVSALRLEGGFRVVTLEDGSEVTARCLVIASGAEYRTLDVPGLRQMEGAGVYYAATEMEARLCGGGEVVIVGGGNSAGQAAMYLCRYARVVHVVIRGGDLGKNMSRYLVDRVEHAGNIRVHRNTEVVAVEGNPSLHSVTLRDAGSGGETPIPARALFLFIGALPRTEWLRNCVMLDRAGFVLTGDALPLEVRESAMWRGAGRAPFFLETSLPGVFAVGDVRSGSVKRVASAVGEGSMAVSFVHAHIGTPA